MILTVVFCGVMHSGNVGTLHQANKIFCVKTVEMQRESRPVMREQELHESWLDIIYQTTRNKKSHQNSKQLKVNESRWELVVVKREFLLLSRFSTWRICSREKRKKQLDWLVTNTDEISSQSDSLFACSREQIRQVENRLHSWDFGGAIVRASDFHLWDCGFDCLWRQAHCTHVKRVSECSVDRKPWV